MKDILNKLAGADEHDDAGAYDAKMQVLKELRDMAMSMMAGKMGDHAPGMKEVSVAAPDQAGLKKGMDMASDMLDSKGNGSPLDSAAQEVDAEHEDGRNEPIGDAGYMDGAMDESEEESPEDIDAQIAALQAKKAARQSAKY